MHKRIVISGYYGFDNFGDEAILSVLVNRLKNFGFEIVVLSSNPRKTSMNYFVNSIKSFDFFQVAGLLKQSNILISGGGSLLQDVTSLKSLVYYLWVIATALRYKKKVIIFAQGIGPIKNKIAEFFTLKILKKWPRFWPWMRTFRTKTLKTVERFKISQAKFWTWIEQRRFPRLSRRQ